MRYLLAFMLILQAQTPPKPWNGQPYGEDKTPEGMTCMNHKPRPNQTRMMECHCDYICTDEDSPYWPYYPTSDCPMFCKKSDMVRCTCHPEEPCPHMPSGPTIDPKGLSNIEWLRLMSLQHDELKHNGQLFQKH